MATVTQNISDFGTLVYIKDVDRTNRASVLAFQQAWEAFNAQLRNLTVAELNTWATQVNAVRNEVNTLQSGATAQANIALQSATLANGFKTDAFASLTASQKVYSDLFTLINSLVIPTDATYNMETIDEKIASGVLSYGIAYGFGHKSETVLTEKEALNKQLHDNFVMNFALGA